MDWNKDPGGQLYEIFARNEIKLFPWWNINVVTDELTVRSDLIMRSLR